jgi:hypothetical protein
MTTRNIQDRDPRFAALPPSGGTPTWEVDGDVKVVAKTSSRLVSAAVTIRESIGGFDMLITDKVCCQ